MSLLKALALKVPKGGLHPVTSASHDDEAARLLAELKKVARQLTEVADPKRRAGLAARLKKVDAARLAGAKDPAGFTAAQRELELLRAAVAAAGVGAAAAVGAAKAPPVLPRRGEFGFVGKHSGDGPNSQGPATYDAAGARISESEHVLPKGKQKAVTYDPVAKASDYTDAHYEANTTLRVERETALNKTHGNRGGPTADNVGTKRLQAEAAKPTKGINYREDVFMESVDNMKRAAKDTKSKVTEAQIHRAALAEDGELFGIQRMADSGKRLKATAQEVDAAIAKLDFGEAAAPEAAAIARQAAKPGVGARLAQGASKVAETGGKVLAVAGAFAGGYQVGTGLDKIAQGDTAEGAIDVGEGAANLGLSIGTGAAVQSGSLVAEAGAVAGGVTLAAGVAAGASVALAAETVRAAVRGEETPIDVADKFYGTHFGDIAGWVAGDYAKRDEPPAKK